MTVAYVQCRYLRRGSDGIESRCTAEAADDSPDALIVLCSHHLARSMQLVQERVAAAKGAAA